MRKKSLHRILAFSLSGAMLLGMAGCGKKDEGTTAATKDTTVSTAAATEKKTEAATEPATEAVTEAKKEDINVKPGDVIVSMDFEDGETGKFAEYRNGGDFEMTNDNGKLEIHILRCGSCDYANQIYYDGYQLLQGAEYTISFDVSSSIERIIQYRGGQLNGGDYHAYQEDNIKIGPEEQHISADFVMSEESDPAPRLVFNMGKFEDMTDETRVMFEYYGIKPHFIETESNLFLTRLSRNRRLCLCVHSSRFSQSRSGRTNRGKKPPMH